MIYNLLPSSSSDKILTGNHYERIWMNFDENEWTFLPLTTFVFSNSCRLKVNRLLMFYLILVFFFTKKTNIGLQTWHDFVIRGLKLPKTTWIPWIFHVDYTWNRPFILFAQKNHDFVVWFPASQYKWNWKCSNSGKMLLVLLLSI